MKTSADLSAVQLILGARSLLRRSIPAPSGGGIRLGARADLGAPRIRSWV